MRKKNKKDLNLAHNRGAGENVVGLVNNNTKIYSLRRRLSDVSKRKNETWWEKLWWES